MTNKQYDTLKMIALILTPVFAFLASLTNIWHFPYAEQMVATLTALDTLFGSLVIAANKQYKEKNSGSESH